VRGYLGLINKCQISRTWRPVFRPNGTTLCQPRETPWEIFHAMISSPNGAALIFAVTKSNLFRSASLGLFVPDTPKPRALPWADLWLARWAGTQTELHSNAAYWATSNFSDTHTLRMIQSRL